MQANPLRAGIERGELQIGTWVNLVRPPKANREWITRLLDVGVWNLHCPQVESARHAAELVAASRYAPRGLGGNAGHSLSAKVASSGQGGGRRRASVQ